ncbi:6869_t:CDS:2 [Funneliformis geosporum]|uniref:6869_t:CDS:1 n=1 Tax=Funneliformis geosporum TaxID=1117311 RepID=A0A9W4SNB1_9GLOM|nr:6869_t:CDS:2 [Funneliformis geosporum]
MDKKSRDQILRGTFYSVGIGATTGSLVAYIKNRPIINYTIFTGINCGIFGLTFFSIRDACLSFQKSKNPDYGLLDSQTRDIDYLISSTLSGGLTGGFLSAIKRGPRATLSGFVLFSVICGAGQICYSSIYNYRQRLIIKSSNQDQLQPSNTSSQDASRDSNIQHEKKNLGFLDRLSAIKWSPITKLSEEQYKELMKAKEKKRLGDSNKTKNND